MNLRGEQFGLAPADRDGRAAPPGALAQAILQNLFAAVYDFAKGRTLQDDMTAITVKVVG